MGRDLAGSWAARRLAAKQNNKMKAKASGRADCVFEQNDIFIETINGLKPHAVKFVQNGFFLFENLPFIHMCSSRQFDCELRLPLEKTLCSKRTTPSESDRD